jgi:N-methylhydantoinase B
MSYCCDRSRSITWGIFGGLPSYPHGAWLNLGKDSEQFLGTIFSNVKVQQGDSFVRPSAGGGGLGDPLERAPKQVLEDVIDGYVSIERAKKDYGVIIREIDKEIDLYEIDEKATVLEREYIRSNRKGWLTMDIAEVQRLYSAREIDRLDLIRRYGVVLDDQTGDILPKSTEQYRETLYKRTLQYWAE